MELLTTDTLRALVQPHEPPCVSIYMPTHRNHPDNQQDRIRFRNLVRTVEESLRRAYSGRDARPLLVPLQALADDAAFWTRSLDGLAVLVAAGDVSIFRLQRPVKELADVADSFHLKPLLRVVQSADRYHVLGLSRHTARVFEGNRYALAELDPGEFPTDIETALGGELTEPHQTVAVYGTGTRGPGPMYHGHGSRKDEVDIDTERYFRAVDRAFAARFSKPSGLPLVLAALAEHHAVFRAVTQNPALLPGGVTSNPEGLSGDELRAAAWNAVEPRYLARLAELTDAFNAGAAHGKATADLADAALAAVQGRVATLLVEAERVIPGRLEPTTGAVAPGALEDPHVGDLLDDLAEVVLRAGGDVVVVPKDRMPSPSGLAAIMRY